MLELLERMDVNHAWSMKIGYNDQNSRKLKIVWDGHILEAGALEETQDITNNKTLEEFQVPEIKIEILKRSRWVMSLREKNGTEQEILSTMILETMFL